MATKPGIEPLVLHKFNATAEAKAAEQQIYEPVRAEIQVLARRLHNSSSVCIALMSTDSDLPLQEIASQMGQEWTRRTELKVCIASLPSPGPTESRMTPSQLDGDTNGLSAIPGRVVEFSYGHTSTPEMQKVTGDLTRQFDNVIVVLPSPFERPEGLGIARECQGVVLVVKAGVTRRSVIKRAISELEEAGATVSGVVLYDRRYPIPQWLYDRI
jgi:hypothetical protein